MQQRQPRSSAQHALVPRSGQLLRTMRPLSGAFWLNRLHAERVALTAEAALEFCGGDAEDGCNCCCDGAILGPAGFLEDVNQCTADYCYGLNEKHYSNCTALYAEVSSDGVPRISPPSPSQPPHPPRSPPCPPGPSPQPPPRPSPGDSANAETPASPDDAETSAAQPNPSPPVPLLPYPGVACNLTLAGTTADFDRAGLQQDLATYLSDALGRPLLLADVGAEVPAGGGIVAASVDPASIIVVLTIRFAQEEEAQAEQARDALAALLDDGGTRSLDDVLDVTVEQHTLPQLVELPPPDDAQPPAAPPHAPLPFLPRPSPPQPPTPPPYCPSLLRPPSAPSPWLDSSAPAPPASPRSSSSGSSSSGSSSSSSSGSSSSSSISSSSSSGGGAAPGMWRHAVSLLSIGGGPSGREKRTALFGMYDGVTM